MTLETVGEFNFNGKLGALDAFSAHGKIDPDNGCYYNHGLGVGRKGPQINVYRISAAGELEARTAIPVKLFCSHVVRDHLVEDEPVLVSKMKKAGMNFTNMCTVSYAGMKGFSERTYGVTNSPKTRNYYPDVRYLTDSALIETICTGDIPQGA